MFKRLKEFIDDVKRRDEELSSFDGKNDKEVFDEDFGGPSQPNNEEDKPNLFDELGGITAPESDECDEEDKNEKEISSDELRKKNFFETFFQLQGFFPDDDDDEI